MASALLFYLLLSTPLLPGVGSHASLGTFGHNYLSHLRLRGGDHDSMSPFDVSELKAFDVASERVDLIHGQEDLVEESDDMQRPCLAKGIRSEDVGLQQQFVRGEQPQVAVNLNETCQWCDEKWQREVKLLKAARLGDLEGVLQAIESGAGVEARDKTHMNWTAVHHAAFYGHAELVERLVDFGADVNARDVYEWAPLHYAALKGRTDTCVALLHCGADVMALTHTRKTPLQKAVYTYQTGPIKVLCEWMGIPPDDFLAEEPPDPEVIRRAMSLDQQEAEALFQRKRPARPDGNDSDSYAGEDAAKVIDVNADEELGGEGPRNEEDEADAAEFRAEYMRRFEEQREFQTANPALE